MKIKTIVFVLLLLLLPFFTFSESLSSTESFTKAKAYYDEGNYENALEWFQKDVEELLENEERNQLEIATTYKYIGNCYYFLGLFEKDIEYQEKSLKIRIKLLGEDNLDVAYNYNFLGDAYYEVGKYCKASEYYEKSLDKITMICGENFSDVLIIRNNLGKTYAELGNYTEALDLFKKTLDISIEIYGENNIDVAKICCSMGIVYSELGDYLKALKYYERSLIILSNIHEESIFFANLYNSLGIVYMEIGDYSKALEYYERDLDISIKFYGEKSPEVSSTYNNVGILYDNLNDYWKALKYYKKCLDIDREVYGENHPFVACSLNNIAIVFGKLGFYSKAIEYSEKSLSMKIDFYGKSHPSVARSFELFGDIYQDMEKYSEALEYYQKGLSMNVDFYGEDHFSVARSYDKIGKTYCELNQIESENECYKKVLNIYGSLQNFNEIICTCWDFVNSPDLQSLHKKSVQTGIDAVERAIKFLSEDKQAILRKALPLYYAGVDLTAKEKEYDKAFEYSEKLRSRGFLEEVGTDAALKLPELTSEEISTLKNYMEKIPLYAKNLELKKSKSVAERNENLVKELETELAKKQKEFKALEKEIGDRIPEYTQLRNPVTVTADEAKKWCGKNRVILEYVMWNPDYASVMQEKGLNTSESLSKLSDSEQVPEIGSYCLVITNKKITAVKLDGEYDYDATIKKLREFIMKGRTLSESSLNIRRMELYEKLIAPVEKYIPSRTRDIVIVPDGNLSSLPFEILGNGKGKDFGEKYNLSFSPSVSVSMLKQKNQKTETKFLGFGNPVYNTDGATKNRGLNDLPDVEPAGSRIYANAGEYYAERKFKGQTFLEQEWNLTH